MDNFDIEASLRKIDKKFTDQLTQQEKKKAIRQFKQLYAEEMSKLAGELSKRVKVQENLSHINQREIQDARQIDDQLKKKMEKVQENREKFMGSKMKQYKLCEENWKRRFQEILRKNRLKERQAFRKAEKMRKDVQDYWNKKGETLHLKQSSVKNDRQNTTFKPYTSHEKEHTKVLQGSQRKTQYSNNKKMSLKVNLPEMNKTKINKVDFGNKMLNKSMESTLNQEIRTHQQRSLKQAREEQSDKIHKYLQKLEKIQKTRKNAQQRVQREVKESKRLRQLRENPETLAANRKRSIEQFGSKSKSKLKNNQRLRQHNSNDRSQSRSNLDASIYQHLQSKKLLKQQQFWEREQNYEQSKQKIKQTKINRLVKDTINMLKHQTLTE